ncbi:MAG: hypothetical protein K2X57_29110 [Xanthobacteraceae bacterium]|nr:hypothetical protein [Xanthobacteraceae bacterium]
MGNLNRNDYRVGHVAFIFDRLSNSGNAPLLDVCQKVVEELNEQVRRAWASDDVGDAKNSKGGGAALARSSIDGGPAVPIDGHPPSDRAKDARGDLP